MYHSKGFLTTLFIGLFFIFTFAGCTRSTSVPGKIDDALELLPEDSDIVVAVNLAELRGKNIFDQFKDDTRIGRRERRRFREFVEETGFNPEKDLDQVVIAIKLDRHDIRDATGIAAGNFDQEKIKMAIEEKRDFEEVGEYQGYKIYAGDHGDFAFSFLDDDIIAFGNERRLRKIINIKKGDAKNLKSNDAIMDLIDEVKYKDQLWAVSNTGDLMARAAREISRHNPGFKAARTLSSIKSVSFSIKVTDNLALSLEGICTNEDEVKLLVDAAKGMLAFGKLGTADDAEMQELLNEIEIKGDDHSITVSAYLTEAMLRSLSRFRDDMI